MSLIDETYFAYEPCFLGNFESSNGYGEVIQPKLVGIKRSINRFEPEYLKLLMGEELYAEYVSTISDAKWLPLIAKLKDTSTKISPIANFVYFYHRNENSIVSGDNGDYVPKMDNMQSVGVGVKMVIAWNDMVRLNATLMRWIYDYIITAETPAIETTATWDISKWDCVLLEYKNRWI